MAKNSFYKKLVRKFEFTINNYQAVNSEFDSTKIEKIISNQKKDKRYYIGIQQFLVYLRKFKDKNGLNFISNKSREKYKHSLENLESLLIVTLLEKETRLSATAEKKSNLKSLVMQPFLSMLFFLQLFTKQIITARPLEASRKTRSTNNCVIKGPHCYEYNDNLDMTMYQDDLQKSAGFSMLFKHKQSIEFRFKDTIFILSENCLSRQSLDKKPQTLCQSDYTWFLSSMTIYFLGNKVRTEALQQELSRQNDAAFAKIIQEICLINSNQQDARQLMGMDRLENFYERELENFIFNSKYVRDTYLSTFHGGNSSNLVSRINQAVREKITDLKLESEESNAFTSLNRDNYSRPLPETESAISGVLQTDINTPSSISHRSAEGFNWMIIVPVAVGGIGIIIFMTAIIIWYSKKNRSENSGLATEGIPLLKSISDNLHVLEIAGRLTKRLESLKKEVKYHDEIKVHYNSFCLAKTKEDAIEELKKIQGALTKFLEPKKKSNKAEDKILSNQIESALLIVESLMQRYNLLSLPNTHSSKNNYLTKQQKSGLEDASNSLLDTIEIVRINFEGDFFKKYNIKENESKLIYLDFLLDIEKASYDTTLCAHIEGYFENYERNEVINCLNLKFSDTNPVVNNEIHWKNLQNLQSDLASLVNLILIPSKKLSEEFLKLKDEKLFNAIKPCIIKFECMKSQLGNYSGYCKARWEQTSKLQKQTQAPKPPQNTKLSRKCTM